MSCTVTQRCTTVPRFLERLHGAGRRRCRCRQRQGLVGARERVFFLPRAFCIASPSPMRYVSVVSHRTIKDQIEQVPNFKLSVSPHFLIYGLLTLGVS